MFQKHIKMGSQNPKLDQALQRKYARHCVECYDEKGLQFARAGYLLECISCDFAGELFVTFILT
jgi:hypothetical protein